MRKQLIIITFLLASFSSFGQKKTIALVYAELQQLKQVVAAMPGGTKVIDYAGQIATLQAAQVQSDINIAKLNKALTDSLTKVNKRLTDSVKRLNAVITAIKVYAPVDITPLLQRLTTLESKPTGSVDITPLLNRLSVLEGKTIPDVAPLVARLTVLESKPATTFDPAPLADRIAALEIKPIPDITPVIERVTALENKTPSTVDIAPLQTDILTIKGQLANLPAAKDYSADINAVKAQVAAIKVPDYTPDLTALKTQVAAIKFVDYKPLIDNISAQLAKVNIVPFVAKVDSIGSELATTKKNVDALPSLVMRGFPGSGTDTQPFENTAVPMKQADRLALKARIGWKVYQTDAPEGEYLMKSTGWVFVK